MNNNQQFDGTPEKYVPLARWLQHILVTPQEEKAESSSSKEDNSQFELAFEREYHPQFHQQLPNFVLALLNNDPQATVQYAPLLYHLIDCTVCHTAYLELYDAMGAALHPSEGPPPHESKITRPLSTIPSRQLVHLSQLFISQAEAVLYNARREHTDNDALARSLLQQAMKVSAQITQSSMRSRALKDLVPAATLFEGPSSPDTSEPAALSYVPSLIGTGGPRGKRVRTAKTIVRSIGASSQEQAIYLHAHHLAGTITQDNDTLKLHLHDLDETLRGHYVIISVPLGSLIEPVQWRGGNPRAIRSLVPVDEHGTLKMPLGQTALRLSDTEDHEMLEVMFSLLEVRVAN